MRSMKVWIGLGIAAALVVVAGMFTLVYRGLSADSEVPALNGLLAQQGLEVATSQGCIACHTLDGSPGIGPTWLGMYGRTESLVNGQTVVVDEDYIRESITSPDAKLVAGYENVMIRYFLSQAEMEAIIEFTRQLGLTE